MEISKQDRQLIDRYLADQLTGSDLDDFHHRMQHDADFRSLVQLHSLLQLGIEKSHEEHYKELVLSSIRYRKSLVPMGLKLIFFFLFVMLSASMLWFYLAPDTGRDKPQFSFFQNKKSAPENAAPKPGKKKGQVNEVPTAASETKPADTLMAVVPSDEENVLINDSGVTMNSTEADDIVVKKDEILISYRVPITHLSDGKDQEAKEDLSGAVAEKLNPSAGLPEQEEASASGILTEFWVSPINYRGYRLMNNKLILFGIEEPDRVKLFRMKDNLYMNYQNSYYRLYPSDDFSSYQRIKEAEVPLAIRSSK
jgi:hypothetical protein